MSESPSFTELYPPAKPRAPQQAGPAIADRRSPVPLYYQLKQYISAQIANGELSPGQQLPGESELCNLWAVSRTVVRQALSELAYEGLIDRQRGKGTFVAKPKVPEGLISGLTGLADDVAQRGQKLESRVLLLREAPATASIAAKLQLRPGEPIIELERLRFVDGQAWVLVVTYLPAILVPGLIERDLGGSESLYRILREEYKVPILSTTRRVEAALADDREARLFGIRRGDPIIVLRSLSSTAGPGGPQPLEYFVAHHRGDQSAFEIVLTATDTGQVTGPSRVIRVMTTDD